MIIVKIKDERYNLPENWGEVTLQQFQQINLINYDNEKPYMFFIYLLNVLTGIEVDDLMKINKTQFFQLQKPLFFITNTKIEGTYEKQLELNGNKYTLKNFKKLTLGEYISLEMLIKENDIFQNAHKILAVLFKKNEEEFDANEIENIAKEFLEVSVDKLMKVITFFLLLEEQYSKVIQLYLAKKKLKEMRGNPKGLMALWYWIADGCGLAWWRGWHKGTSYASMKFIKKTT